MDRSVLVKGIEIVGVLFAAFGGFLVGIAPPQTADAKFAVGISSLLALIILFTIVALAKKEYRTAWIITAVCLFMVGAGAAYYYKTIFDELTFAYPAGSTKIEYVAGTELTTAASDYRQQHQGISNAQLLAKFGGLQNRGKVWPEDSANKARRKLTSSYVILVLALATAIFALTEGVLGITPPSGSGKGSKKPKRSRRKKVKPQPTAADAQP